MALLFPRAVATWPFENGAVQELTWPTLECSLDTCMRAVSILHSCGLLHPKTVCFSQWMRAGKQGVAGSERIARADLIARVDEGGSLMDVVPLCRSCIDTEAVYPLTIEIAGAGAIITRGGESVVDNLVWIRATTLEVFRIAIATQSDAWMPFTLKGKPQPDVHALNADRLMNALEAIERQTGLKLEDGAESEYAVMRGYRLDNFRYGDGSIADVS